MNNKQAAQGAGVSKLVDELATISVQALLQRLGTSEAGLSEEEAEKRLNQFGPNEVAAEKEHTWVHRLFNAARNPLVALLTVLATVSYATGDLRAGTVMLLMVILGLGLRFVQETRADAAAAKLKAMISVTATVVRNGEAREIPISQLVPGDIVQLSAGDMIPADVRLLSAKDLFIIQATLTGESMPVEKMEAPDTRQGIGLLERCNACFLGTSVESGTAKAVVIATGSHHLLRSHRTQPRRATGGNEFRPRHQEIHVADDSFHACNGAAGLRHKWPNETQLARGVLLFDGGRGGAHSGNAADDCVGLFVQGRDGDVAQEGHRQAAGRDSELRGDGRVLHGQDRHTDDGSHHSGAALQHS